MSLVVFVVPRIVLQNLYIFCLQSKIMLSVYIVQNKVIFNSLDVYLIFLFAGGFSKIQCGPLCTRLWHQRRSENGHGHWSRPPSTKTSIWRKGYRRQCLLRAISVSITVFSCRLLIVEGPGCSRSRCVGHERKAVPLRSGSSHMGTSHLCSNESLSR